MITSSTGSQNIMSSWPHKQSWGTPEAQRQIAKKLQRGSVTLVLGAGLSLFYGLPSWKDLLSNLKYNGKGHAIPEQPDYEQWAQDILVNHFCSDEVAFNSAVAEGLYGNPTPPLNDALIRGNETLRAICALGTNSMKGKLDSIVTFNYDSLLENYYEREFFNVRPITRENQSWEKSDIHVYHPHGFIPHPECSFQGSESIVLAKSQYTKTINSHWESTLENLFSTRFCIFVGVSGADRRLKKIMQRVNSRNEFAYQENYWGFRITTAHDRRIPMWDRRGVYSKTVSDFNSGIPEILNMICQFAVNPK